MSLLTDFGERFQEFSPLNRAVFDGLESTLICIYGVPYGTSDKDDVIIQYLCAHLYFIDIGDSSSPKKAVQSRSVGGVLITYGSGNEDRNTVLYNSTKYGQRFLMLTDSQRDGVIFT